MANRVLCAIGVVVVAVSSALALEGLPKRKPGLWEIRNGMQGRPMALGPIQICTDEKSDNLMQLRADEAKQKCSVMEWKRDGDRITVNSMCKIMEGQTAATTAIFSGSLDSGYRGDIHISYDPPIHGRTEMNMTISAKWLGPCKEGQKPGDVVMPNFTPGKAMPNVQELMKMRNRMKSIESN
jgi:hypothetical protein